MEMLVYSQDRMYSSSLSDRKKEETIDGEDFSERRLGSFLYSKNNNATLQELMLHLKAYYKVRLNLDKQTKPMTLYRP